MSRIPILWPELKVDAVSPAAVLQVQAASLEQLTHGLLIGQVVRGDVDKQEYLHLDIVAPAVGTSFRVVTITHKNGFPYPASVTWVDQTPFSAVEIREREAWSEENLSEILKEVLSSSGITAAVYSLLARSNDVENTSTTSANSGEPHRQVEVGALAE